MAVGAHLLRLLEKAQSLLGIRVAAPKPRRDALEFTNNTCEFGTFAVERAIGSAECGAKVGLCGH
jgi:hypothetical protein